MEKQEYLPCSGCGTYRWVRIVKGMPRSPRCKSCQTIRMRQAIPQPTNRPLPDKLELGMIFKGREIGLNNKHNDFIWHACAICGKKRWVLFLKGKPNVSICQSCQLAERLKKAHAIPHPTGENHPMWRGGNIKRICLQCGGEFETKRCLVRKGYGKYCSRSCTMIASIKDGLLERRPTKPEQRMQDIITRHNLPFKYTGDGQMWIGKCNPDFININKTRQVIEVFGVYWHDILDVSKRIEAFRRHRFTCLVFWEDELTNERRVVTRIQRFLKPS